MSVGLLFDATRCVGCGACAAACKEQNDLPLPIEAKTTAYTWTTVQAKAGTHVRRLCMHCLDPTCVSVCPFGAMHFVAADRKVIKCDLCDGDPQCVRFCEVKAVDWVDAGDLGLHRGREAAKRLYTADRKAAALADGP